MDGQELMGRFEMIQQALQQLDGQLDRLDANATELRRALSTIDGLGDAGDDALIPIGGGVHVRAKVASDQPLVVPVGRGYAADQDAAAAKASLQERLKELDGMIQEKTQEAQRLSQEGQQIAQQLQSAQAQQQEPSS